MSINNVLPGPGSWAAKRALKRSSRYVGLYNPGEVFVNHLEIEKKKAQAELKAQRKAERKQLSFTQRIADRVENFVKGLFSSTTSSTASAKEAFSEGDLALAKSMIGEVHVDIISHAEDMAQTIKQTAANGLQLAKCG